MTNHHPLVSVVLPVHNGAAFLAEAIDSVLAQTYPNIEVIVVDDGSTDRGSTAEVAKSFGALIRCIHKPNGGVATALNLGIELMKGELFSWLSHDDRYEPEKIAVQVETWRRHGPHCVVVGDYDVIDEHGTHLFDVRTESHNLHARPLDGVFQGVLNGCAMLIPRAAFDRVGMFSPGLPVTQDYDLWFRMARELPFVRSPGSLVRYRSHAAQGSRQSLHLEQVSRLISHFADATPDDEMRAYEGSPIRFLQRLRQTWQHYAGAQAALDRRIATLLGAMPFAAVVLGPRAGAIADTTQALAAHRPKPVELLHLPVEGDAVVGPMAWAALAERASGVRADIVLLLTPDDDHPPIPVQKALEEMATGADIARPCDHASRSSPLDGLIIRRRLIPTLCAALRAGDLGLSSLTAAAYPVPAAEPEGKDDDLTAALEGRRALGFRDRPHHAARAIRRRLAAYLPTILLIGRHDDHDRAVHACALAAALGRRANCLFLGGDSDGCLWLSLTGKASGGLRFDLPRQFDELVTLLQAIGIVRADVHHTLGFENLAKALLGALGVPYDLTLIDHHFIGPEEGAPEENGAGDPSLLVGAQRVIAVSRTLARDAARRHPAISVLCAGPLIRTAVDPQHVFAPRVWQGEPLRVLVAGTITPALGREVLLAAARLVRERRLPIEFHVVGTIKLPLTAWAALKGTLFLHGPTEEEAFSDTVIGLGPHVAWFPIQTPEAGLHTLTRVIGLCFPMAAGAVGSIVDRCEGRPFTWLLPWDSSPEAWITLFLGLHASELRTPPQWGESGGLPAPQPDFYPNGYLGLEPGPRDDLS